jgi:hypothetical protein
MGVNVAIIQPRCDARSAYLERCLFMAKAMGYDLESSISAWLTTSGSFHDFGNSEWRTRLLSMIVPSPTEVGARSDFLSVLSSSCSMRAGYSNRGVPPIAHPRLICRATPKQARAVHRGIRETRDLTSWREQSGAPWIVDGCEYLVGTPEQLVEWCGYASAARWERVQLNCFDYKPVPALVIRSYDRVLRNNSMRAVVL